MEKLVIVGGGVAGLSCLNALLDNQVSPLLIEGGSIGSPKMCGEFLAPSGLSLLNKWDIGPVENINHASFHSSYSHFNIDFQQPAGAMMRSEVEHQLSKRAQKLNGRILENTRLAHITPATKNSPYLLRLESGDIIEAETAIFATGKLWHANKKKIQLPYFGIKLHVDAILSPATLHMYSTPGAYFGMVPISSTRTNLTCLLKKSNVNTQDHKQLLKLLIKDFPILNHFFDAMTAEESNWLTSAAPEFSKRKIAVWPEAYWIGDALTSLHPAIGSGFAHSISSGVLAADYYLQKKPDVFISKMNSEINKKFMLGKLMHHVLLHPFLTSMVFPLLQGSPWFLNKCLKRLGYTN